MTGERRVLEHIDDLVVVEDLVERISANGRVGHPDVTRKDQTLRRFFFVFVGAD